MYDDGGQQFGQNNRQNIANQHTPMGGMGGMGGMNGMGGQGFNNNSNGYLN